MSLSQRFSAVQAKVVTKPAGNQKSLARSVAVSNQPPRTPKGGVKKVQKNDNNKFANKKDNKKPKQGDKGPKAQNKKGNKPKKVAPKTQEELDAEMEIYTKGKEAYLSSKLDADMDDYHAKRAQAAAAEADAEAAASS